MSTKHYPNAKAAKEAGIEALANKYGCHPKFYVYRESDGYGYSKVTTDTQRNSQIVVQASPSYFREALKAIIGKYPPMAVPPYGAEPMGDEVVGLQDWCSDNANPPWATGLSMIEAAELIVQQAIENANIKKI
jgi:hypothetical protein